MKVISAAIFLFASLTINAVIAPPNRLYLANTLSSIIIEAPEGKHIKVLASTKYFEDDTDAEHQLMWSQDETGCWHVYHSYHDLEVDCVYGASPRTEIVLELQKVFDTSKLTIKYPSDVEIVYTLVPQERL